jgi:hypothetical protein
MTDLQYHLTFFSEVSSSLSEEKDTPDESVNSSTAKVSIEDSSQTDRYAAGGFASFICHSHTLKSLFAPKAPYSLILTVKEWESLRSSERVLPFELSG